jgi:OOP family OmpA-OmpF porin
MLTLQQMPEEIKSFILEHGLVKVETFTDERQTDVQLAQNRIIDVVLKGFGELAKPASGRELLWNAARDAKEAGSVASPTVVSPQGADLVKSALDDRYHGTVNTIAKETGLQVLAVTRLLEVIAAAALTIMGGLVAEYHWSALQLAEWLRPHQAAVPFAPVSLPAAAAAPIAASEVSGAAAWFTKNTSAMLVAVSVIAAAEFGYILNTRSESAASDVTTVAAAPATDPNAIKYVALPVANLSATRVASSTKTAVPVVLKLKNGVRQIIGSNSTESKLYQFLIDPSKEVDAIDPTKNWIGFDRIYFDTNKATLTNESLWQLSNVASILKRFPAAKIKVGGYTDNSGSPLRNLQLSKERAQATMTSLVSLGVPADHLTAIGYGVLDNIADNSTEEGRALNRRVSLQVTQK